MHLQCAIRNACAIPNAIIYSLVGQLILQPLPGLSSYYTLCNSLTGI